MRSRKSVSGAGTTYNGAFKADGSGSYQKLGTLVAPGKTVAPPGNNFALRNFADIILKGNSCVRFNGNGTVTTWSALTTWGSNAISCPETKGTTTALKDGMVIWADNNGSCSGGYVKAQKYTYDFCGDIAVWGKYDANVTIGAANDIIVAGDTTRPSDSDDWLLGLVANQFVRVYHPIKFGTSNTCDKSSTPNYSTAPVTKITAAILATRGSFITDNWYCAPALGDLTVMGTIAQYWRGAVGTSSGGTAATGYAKNYTYDNRLKYREPPQFLDPGTSQWHVLRESEQVPVATG